MASNNKQSAKRRTTSSSKRRYKRTKKDYELLQDIKIVLVVALSVFLFVCNFGVIGKFGDVISSILFGTVGLLNYIFPIFLGFLIVFNELNPGNPVAIRKTVFSSVLFLLVDMSLDLIDGISKNLEKYSIKDIFDFSYNEKRGGGVIAGSINYGLLKSINTWGTVLVIIVLSLISIIVLTEKSLLKTVKEKTEQVRAYKDEEKQFKEELYEERLKTNERKRDERLKEKARREEEKTRKSDEKVLRKNKQMVGVTINTDLSETTPVIPDAVKNKNDDMHEINLNDFEPSTLKYTAHSITEDIDEEDEIIEERPDNEISGTFTDIEIQNPAPSIIGRKPKPVAVKPVEDNVTVNATDMSEYVFPPLSLLTKGVKKSGDSAQHIRQTASKLEQTLATFGVKATVTDFSQGPSVTRYELQPDIGVKVSRIKNLTDDIKLSLAATELRIEAPIPGKAAIGIEIPNKESQPVMLRDLLDTPEYRDFDSNLPFAVGKDIAGKPLVYSIDSFPHLLIAGATGSGKSVCINTLIMSIIYKANPDDVKLIMIDPKVVELSVYNGIPHLLLPVVTDTKKAAATLNFAVNEMNERYKLFESVGVRNFSAYQKVVKERGEDPFLKKIPNIVIIVDEMAELMMQERKSVEENICSLAQLARAAGMYLVIATQRPSVDVITGLIKANMPSRLAFAVTSQIDSRTILDMGGAEELLGKGDMLFFPKGFKKPLRLQGGFVSDKEVSTVVDFLKKQGLSSFDPSIEEKIKSCEKKVETSSGSSDGQAAGTNDSMFVDAAFYVIDTNKASIGNLQRKFSMGFNRAARIMDQLEEAGVVGPEVGTKPRQVLMGRDQFENYLEEYGG